MTAELPLEKKNQLMMLAFSPILNPAFRGNVRANVLLTEAFDAILKRDLNGAKEKLILVEPECHCDADHAARLFFLGYAHEQCGDREGMLPYYQEAGRYGHNFRYPYLLLAREYYDREEFAQSAENYQRAIDCTKPGDRQLPVFYDELATVLIFLHEYDRAEEALKASAALAPRRGRLDETRVLLWAARGDREQAEKYVKRVERRSQNRGAQARNAMEQIFSGKHRLFPAKTE